MCVQVHIHMKNNNFVPVTINMLNVSIMHDMMLVGSVNKTSGLALPPRSDMEVRTATGEGTLAVGQHGMELL